MKKIFLYLLVLSVQNVFTQEQYYFYKGDTIVLQEDKTTIVLVFKDSYAGRCSIKINPLQLLYCGEARILFEKPISERSSFELIGSYLYNFDYNIDYNIVNIISKFSEGVFVPTLGKRSGFKAGISYRYYFGNNKKIYFNPLFFLQIYGV